MSDVSRLDEVGSSAEFGLGPKREELIMWKTIDSAPMDGTSVLVMRDIWPGTTSGRAETCNGHNTYVAAWWASDGSDGRDGKGRWVCYMDAVFDPTCPIVPTHWMPLPLPPSARAAQHRSSEPARPAERTP